MKKLIFIILLDTTQAKMFVKNCFNCTPYKKNGYVVTDGNCNVVNYLTKRKKVINNKIVIDYYLIKKQTK